MLSQEDRERFNADLKLVKQILQENREKGIRKYAMFLDFDGVIHVFYVQGTPQYEAAIKRMKTKLDFIDPQCLANVDRLTGEFDMDVFRMLTLKNTKMISACPQLYKFVPTKMRFDFMSKEEP